ncbi:MAG: GNAT family N-acetyltransferase [Alphaproteobacteria bacterium]
MARVYVAGWRDAYPGVLPNRVLRDLSAARQEQVWRASILNEARSSLIHVAIEDGRVVGFGSAGRTRFGTLPFAGEVFTLYVETDARGRGIGRELLFRLFGALEGAGHRSALVWALAGNPYRHFYAAVGGRQVAAWTERQWGVPLRQVAYGWADLAAVRAAWGAGGGGAPTRG